MNCWRSAVTMQRSCASSVVAKADREQQVCADLFGAVIFGRNVTAGRLPRFWRGSYLRMCQRWSACGECDFLMCVASSGN